MGVELTQNRQYSNRSTARYASGWDVMGRTPVQPSAALFAASYQPTSLPMTASDQFAGVIR